MIHTLKNQILSLVIDISTNAPENFMSPDNETIFTLILSIFTNLQYLNFCPSSIQNQGLFFNNPYPGINSSTLLELHIRLKSFSDCLYILDGRFNNLHTLHVDIDHIFPSDSRNNNQVNYFG